MKYTQGAIGKDFNNYINALDRASVQALNKTTNKVFTEVKRGVAKDTGIPQKVFASGNKKMLFKRKASNSHRVAVVWAKGDRIPIGRMKPRKRKGGVTFISRGGQRTLIPGAFLVERPGGKIVFKRIAGASKQVSKSDGSYRYKGQTYKQRKIKRQPLAKLLGPSIPSVMAKPFVAKIIDETVQRQWPVEYERALKAQIGRRRK